MPWKLLKAHSPTAGGGGRRSLQPMSEYYSILKVDPSLSPWDNSGVLPILHSPLNHPMESGALHLCLSFLQTSPASLVPFRLYLKALIQKITYPGILSLALLLGIPT